MKQQLIRIIICVVVLASTIAACSSPRSTPSTPTRLPNGIVGGMVDVGGRELFYKCIGEGNPTVILEAGGDSDSAYWDKVMAYLGGATRVCTYDRANTGNSDGAPKPRSAQDMVGDLHTLLVNANIDKPYILVGHSGGGLLVRLFADQYPDQVAGMVLVDAAHPEMGSRLLDGLPPVSTDEQKSLDAYRQWFSWMSGSKESLFQDLEGWDMQVVNEQVKAVQKLGKLPLVVISRSPDDALLVEGMPPLPPETAANLSHIWQDMQSELVGLSSNSAQVFAQGGHDIPSNEPKLIVEALRKLVNESRGLAGETSVANPSSPAMSADHIPTILRIVERQERKDGRLIFYKDVYFTDAAGDAVVVEASMISGDLGDGQHVEGGILDASAEEQKGEAMMTATWVCFTQGTYVMEMKINDRADNASEPIKFTFPCPAPQNISLFLIIGLVTGVGVLAAGWLLVRYRHARQAST